MQELPLWRDGRAAKSLDTRPLRSYRQDTIALVHQAPAVMVGRVVAGLRRAAAGPGEDPHDRWAAIARAGHLLAEAELGGTTAAQHAQLVTHTTGAPITASHEALAELGAFLQQITGALRWQAPGGDLAPFTTRRVTLADGRSYAWVPEGQVLGFIAPSNHPAVHATWVLALAMGWTVALRPGADDPLTPWRLVLALQAAGFPTDRVALLPGGHDLVPAIVAACDRTVAYGGATLGSLLGQDRRVLFNGPGHSKVLVDAPVETDPAADFLFASIAHDGGRKCTCASAVVVRGEAGGLIDGLAARLAALPLLDPLDPTAIVPAWKDPSALRQSPAAVAVTDGIAFAKPALIACTDPTSPPFGVEIPAPWATAVTLPPAATVLPILRGSLAVTLLSQDHTLRAACLLEPTIRKVFMGPIPPWQTEPGAPHQGRLSDFLFTAKYAPEVTAWHSQESAPS